MKVLIRTVRDFSPAENLRLIEATKLLERVINSDAFKSEILGFSHVETTGKLWWKKSRTVFGFSENRDKTSREIYADFCSGATAIAPLADDTLDLNALLYTNYSSRVIGYTYLESAQIWMNKKFFDTMSAAEIAGNIAHEYSHELGYTHLTTPWATTVPYAIGEIVARIGRSIY